MKIHVELNLFLSQSFEDAGEEGHVTEAVGGPTSAEVVTVLP